MIRDRDAGDRGQGVCIAGDIVCSKHELSVVQTRLIRDELLCRVNKPIRCFTEVTDSGVFCGVLVIIHWRLYSRDRPVAAEA